MLLCDYMHLIKSGLKEIYSAILWRFVGRFFKKIDLWNDFQGADIVTILSLNSNFNISETLWDKAFNENIVIKNLVFSIRSLFNSIYLSSMQTLHLYIVRTSLSLCFLFAGFYRQKEDGNEYFAICIEHSRKKLPKNESRVPIWMKSSFAVWNNGFMVKIIFETKDVVAFEIVCSSVTL